MAQLLIACLKDYCFWGYAGGLCGAFLGIRNLVHEGIHPVKAGLIVIAGVYGALLGARLLFLIDSNPRALLSNPATAFVFWEGGLSWLGGPLLAALGGGIVILALRVPFWQSLGSLTIAFPVAHAIGRVGCLVRGCCYGKPSSLPWAVYSSAVGAYAHPTQAYCMVCEACVAVLIQYLHREPRLRKYLFPLYVLLSALHRFITEAFRGTHPGPELIGGLRFYQSICVLLFSLSIITLLLLKNRRHYIPHAACILVLTASLFVLLPPKHPSRSIRSQKAAGPYLVLTRPLFRVALAEWVRLRERQGFRVDVEAIEDEPTVTQVQELIKELSPLPSYVLIVGDCAAPGETPALWHLPSPVTGSGEVSDVLYGDVDGDGFPDFPVGRLPVRNEMDLQRYVKKLQDYEQDTWSQTRRIVTWIGVPGFDGTLQREARLFADVAPKWADNILLSGVDMSQDAAFLQAISLPTVLSIVVSHGSRTSVGPHREVSVRNVDGLYSQEANGPMFLLACFSGEYNGKASEGCCFAEALLMQPGGPIATVASSGSVDPAANYAMALAMADVLRDCNNLPKTVGTFSLNVTKLVDKVLRKEESQTHSETYLRLLEYFGETKAETFRRQILSYNLLGDPSAPIHIPPCETPSQP